MAYGICLGTRSWGQDKSGATGGIKASHRSWNVVGWSLACRINRWAVNSTLKILSHNSLMRGLCRTLCRWTLVLSRLLFFIIVKATAVDATTTGPTRNWCWTSSDHPAESPKSSHHHQEVKDRTFGKCRLSTTLKTFSAVTTAYNTSTLHTEITIWNRKVALSRYNTALFYSVNVLWSQCSLESHLPPNPFSPDCSDWTRVPTLRTSNTEQRRPQTFSAAGCVFVAFLRSALQYNEKHFHCTVAMCRWACYRQWWWEVFFLLLTVTKKVASKKIKNPAYLNDLIILF